MTPRTLTVLEGLGTAALCLILLLTFAGVGLFHREVKIRPVTSEERHPGAPTITWMDDAGRLHITFERDALGNRAVP